LVHDNWKTDALLRRALRFLVFWIKVLGRSPSFSALAQAHAPVHGKKPSKTCTSQFH
jgi:hypothetical protein